MIDSTDTSAPDAATQGAARRERVAQDLSRLVEDAQRLLGDATGIDDARIQALQQRLRREVDRVGREIDEMRAAGRAQVRRGDELVREHPYAAIGAAAALGALLGLVLARR